MVALENVNLAFEVSRDFPILGPLAEHLGVALALLGDGVGAGQSRVTSKVDNGFLLRNGQLANFVHTSNGYWGVVLRLCLLVVGKLYIVGGILGGRSLLSLAVASLLGDGEALRKVVLGFALDLVDQLASELDFRARRPRNSVADYYIIGTFFAVKVSSRGQIRSVRLIPA